MIALERKQISRFSFLGKKKLKKGTKVYIKSNLLLPTPHMAEDLKRKEEEKKNGSTAIVSFQRSSPSKICSQLKEQIKKQSSHNFFFFKELANSKKITI